MPGWGIDDGRERLFNERTRLIESLFSTETELERVVIEEGTDEEIAPVARTKVILEQKLAQVNSKLSDKKTEEDIKTVESRLKLVKEDLQSVVTAYNDDHGVAAEAREYVLLQQIFRKLKREISCP